MNSIRINSDTILRRAAAIRERPGLSWPALIKRAAPISLILAVPACATVQNATPTVITAVQRAADAWTVIKATAALWLPRLSPDRQLQVQHAIAIGDQAILTAQTAATVAEATAALGQVNAAADQVTAATR